MLNQFTIAAIVATSFLVLFALSELIYRWAKPETEITRKMVHIVAGIVCLSFPFIFLSIWPVAALGVAFLAIMFISKKTGYLPSIHNVKRKTQGSYLYPLSIFLCFWAYLTQNNILYYFVPISILSVSDPLAAFVGRLAPYGKYTFWGETKTMAGSLAFFISAIIVSYFCFNYFKDTQPTAWLTIGIISLTTSIAEALGRRGEDNLWIPLAAIAVLYGINSL